MIINVNEVPQDKEILSFIKKQLPGNEEDRVGPFIFEELDVCELGVKTSNLLTSVEQIERLHGLEGWQKQHGYSTPHYRGFSLTYNKEFNDKSRSQYHQTFGSKFIKDSFSREASGVVTMKNTYYDTYAFRHLNSTIKEHFSGLFSRIKGAILRSRVAYLYSGEIDLNTFKGGWHIDEPQYMMLRLVIPLKTNENYYLRFDGDDNLGNQASFDKILEYDKAYIWNNRIPHEVGCYKSDPLTDPRINMIVGFSPWFDYDEENDRFVSNSNFGIPVSRIIKDRLFLNDS